MFDSPISKTQMELVTAARTATTDYIQNGTDLTEAVVKAASALHPITSEHVRRICEMTYHDAYERMFAEKTGMYQYVSFDPPDAIRASEMLDALQLGLDQQHNFDKLASTSMKRTTKQRLMDKHASAALAGSIGAGLGAIGGAMSGDQNTTTRQRLGRAVAGGALGGMLGTGAGKLMSNPNEVKNLQKVVDSKQKQVANAEQAANKAVQQADDASASASQAEEAYKAQKAKGKADYDALTPEQKAEADARVEYFSPEARSKRQADYEEAKKNTPTPEPRVSKSVDVPVEEYKEILTKQQSAVAKRKELEAIPNRTPEQEAELSAARKLSQDLSTQLVNKKPVQSKNPNFTLEAPKFQKLPEEEITRLNKLVSDSEAELQFADMMNLPQERRAELQKIISESQEKLRKDMQKTASMPRKFNRMNTHEIWTKAASGTDLPDHNPTRELQQVHRDLKDSISTVKSELYAAEHNEKLAMIDMVKQAKAGLSAGHSMEQVLHAAVSVVDATEPFMAKTAHDLCATIIEACADHQNSGFNKTANEDALLREYFGSDQEVRDKSKFSTGRAFRNAGMYGLGGGVVGGMLGGPGGAAVMGTAGALTGGLSELQDVDAYEKELYRRGLHRKEASDLQEVNPNHPIPQKFKKLAEASTQRKHLEVTLDELNRNMDYFNEQLKNEFLR